MKIAVCMKQVPAYSEGNMDEKTGVIIREGLLSITNTYDMSALETALRIKEKVNNVEISVFTMGPEKAKDVIIEAYSMGADKGFLISDRYFAGSDVLATSYTLMQAIKSVGQFDLILCGKQTTDGDTAQVSGSLAKWLNIQHINWVTEMLEVTEKDIKVKSHMNDRDIIYKASYPILISVEKSIFTTRMPSLKLKMQSKKKTITILTIDDFEDKDKNNYGLKGSATKVKRIFPPERTQKQNIFQNTAENTAEHILNIIDMLKGEK